MTGYIIVVFSLCVDCVPHHLVSLVVAMTAYYYTCCGLDTASHCRINTNQVCYHSDQLLPAYHAFYTHIYYTRAHKSHALGICLTHVGLPILKFC